MTSINSLLNGITLIFNFTKENWEQNVKQIIIGDSPESWQKKVKKLEKTFNTEILSFCWSSLNYKTLKKESLQLLFLENYNSPTYLDYFADNKKINLSPISILLCKKEYSNFGVPVFFHFKKIYPKISYNG